MAYLKSQCATVASACIIDATNLPLNIGAIARRKMTAAVTQRTHDNTGSPGTFDLKGVLQHNRREVD
jgi:hypothetical protein